MQRFSWLLKQHRYPNIFFSKKVEMNFWLVFRLVLKCLFLQYIYVNFQSKYFWCRHVPISVTQHRVNLAAPLPIKSMMWIQFAMDISHTVGKQKTFSSYAHVYSLIGMYKRNFFAIPPKMIMNFKLKFHARRCPMMSNAFLRFRSYFPWTCNLNPFLMKLTTSVRQHPMPLLLLARGALWH